MGAVELTLVSVFTALQAALYPGIVLENTVIVHELEPDNAVIEVVDVGVFSVAREGERVEVDVIEVYDAGKCQPDPGAA